jgi:hypothetical protein
METLPGAAKSHFLSFDVRRVCLFVIDQIFFSLLSHTQSREKKKDGNNTKNDRALSIPGCGVFLHPLLYLFEEE